MLNYHSYETFSTQDWPWIRMVIFLQWCPFRCLYCQNPDTITTDINKEISAEQIITLANKQKEYFWKKWWITFSGWECLLQVKELIPVLKTLKENWFGTCLDTNGFLLNDDVKEALKYTDHVLPDIKWITSDLHKKVTFIYMQIIHNLPIIKQCKSQEIYLLALRMNMIIKTLYYQMKLL